MGDYRPGAKLHELDLFIPLPLIQSGILRVWASREVCAWGGVVLGYFYVRKRSCDVSMYMIYTKAVCEYTWDKIAVCYMCNN